MPRGKGRGVNLPVPRRYVVREAIAENMLQRVRGDADTPAPFRDMPFARGCVARLNLSIRRVCYGSSNAKGPPIDDGEKGFPRFFAIVILCKRPMRLHEGDRPCRKH